MSLPQQCTPSPVGEYYGAMVLTCSWNVENLAGECRTLHLSSQVLHRVHERRGSDRLMHDASMWPVGRTAIVRWKRTESQEILLERCLTCAVMTKKSFSKRRRRELAMSARRMMSTIWDMHESPRRGKTNRHSVIRFFNSYRETFQLILYCVK